jgi:predicted nucleic-acid-binding Zn-ribbon protein
MKKVTFETKKLACPKCGGTRFEHFLVTAKNFNAALVETDISRKRDLRFEMERCVTCGWQTHELDAEKLAKRIQVMLEASSLPRVSMQKKVLKAAGIEGLVLAH